jgi:subtilase family serine protease
MLSEYCILGDKKLRVLNYRVILVVFLVPMLLMFAYPTFVKADQPEWQAQPYHHLKNPDAQPLAVSGNSPTNIKSAYNLPATGGQGTIAIIDAYDNPNAASDLRLFSTQFGLPAANLEVHEMTSTVRGNVNWGVEIALDVQWAHAVAPNAKILLVEAQSASLSDLLSAVNYARNRADVVSVSMSWGASEFSGETSYDSYFTSQYGATFYVSSGDSGAGTSWPAASANVVSVGGTTLALSNGAVTSESAWSGSGGGVSAYEPKPAYQADVQYSNRAIPDVSYDADPNSGFAVYDSYGYGWIVVGGTSAGAPQWAAIQALGLSATDQNIYNAYAQTQTYQADFRDVTDGSNGYSAGVGYDLATGVGSPLTVNFAASPSPDFSISATPNSLTTSAGTQTAVTVNVNALGFSGTVSLSTALPSGWTANPATNSIVGSGSYPLAITPPVGTAGTYTVTVTGTSESLSTHTATITVTVAAPDYSLTANPTTLSVRQGASGTSKITVNALNNYAGTVTLTARTTAPRVTFSFSPNPVAAGNAATLTITVPPFTTRGTYTVTVTGTDTSRLTHQTTITLTITR